MLTLLFSAIWRPPPSNSNGTACNAFKWILMESSSCFYFKLCSCGLSYSPSAGELLCLFIELSLMKTVMSLLAGLNSTNCCWSWMRIYQTISLIEGLKSRCNADEELECRNGTCVPLDLVCNGVNDCGQWEDEPQEYCNRNECAIKNGGCDHLCVDLNIGFKCRCRDGYVLSGNSTCQGR